MCKAKRSRTWRIHTMKHVKLFSGFYFLMVNTVHLWILLPTSLALPQSNPKDITSLLVSEPSDRENEPEASYIAIMNEQSQGTYVGKIYSPEPCYTTMWITCPIQWYSASVRGSAGISWGMAYFLTIMLRTVGFLVVLQWLSYTLCAALSVHMQRLGFVHYSEYPLSCGSLSVCPSYDRWIQALEIVNYKYIGSN